MRLTVFNGSPRSRGSNTALLLEPFLEGFSETAGNTYALHYLALEKEFHIVSVRSSEELGRFRCGFSTKRPFDKDAMAEEIKNLCGDQVHFSRIEWEQNRD